MRAFSFNMKTPLNGKSKTFPKWTCFQLAHLFHPLPVFFFFFLISCPFLVTIYYLKSSSRNRITLCKKSMKQALYAKQTYHRLVETVPKQIVFSKFAWKNVIWSLEHIFHRNVVKWLLSSKVSVLSPCDVWSSSAVELYYSNCFVIHHLGFYDGNITC